MFSLDSIIRSLLTSKASLHSMRLFLVLGSNIQNRCFYQCSGAFYSITFYQPRISCFLPSCFKPAVYPEISSTCFSFVMYRAQPKPEDCGPDFWSYKARPKPEDWGPDFCSYKARPKPDFSGPR